MASVRGDRTVYREREVERDYEEAPRRTYTTVKRYQVPESITRTLRRGEDEEIIKDKIVVRRDHREDPPPPPSSHHHDDVEYRVTERRYESSPPSRERDEVDYRFVERRTERSADPPRRDISYRVIERESDHERPRSEFRVVEKDTEVVRAPSPPEPERVREYRFERERSSSPHRDRPYDLERYSKSTEYFTQPAPQPIIIRESAPQGPIIIREERREPRKIIIRREVEEPQYEFVERKEVRETKEVEEVRDESRSLVKAEPPPEPTPQPEKQPEEDYFYERRVVERRRRSDSYDRRTEIRPRDSASNYSSDDSYEYVRKEKITGDEKDPHHKRHLAEGALAGIGAAEIIRHHRKSKGEPVSGRGRSAIGGAAVGALGAEAISRVRSMRSLRRDSPSRSRSGERHHRRRHRSRSRSKSLTRAQQLGGLAAVAAVGALAGYALKKGGNKETVIVNEGGGRRRRKSTRRRGSFDSYLDDREGPMSPHRDPDHRNRRIAQAGLASAAAAGIWEKVRSQSRGGKARSKSRIRQGVPIAAAGLGGAALAGLYEKNKANKEAKKDAIIEDEMNRGRQRTSRSQSRSSRSVPAPYYDDDRGNPDGPGLIAYGRDPVYPEETGNFYRDEEPGLYRRRGGSSGSSPDTRRYRSGRSRSRGRNQPEPVYADRRRPDDDYYDDRRYDNAPYSPPPPMVQSGGYGGPPQHAPYGQQQQPYFPPPPTGENAHPEPYGQQNAYAPYNPADYAHQQPNQQHPYEASRGAYGESDATLGQPHPNDTFAGDPRYGAQDAGRGRGRPDPENVSAPNEPQPQRERESQEADGLASTPRQRSSSRVRFDLESNVTHSPEANRRKDDAKRGDPSEQRQNDTEPTDEREKRHRRKKRKGKERERERDSKHSHHSHRDGPQYERGRDDRENDSDDTEDLPDRFDEQGNKKPEDSLSQKINELLGSQGGLGGLLKAITSGGGGDGDDESRASRRKSRR